MALRPSIKRASVTFLCLACGAGVTVGIAWWFAVGDVAISRPTTVYWSTSEGPGWYYSRGDGFGWTRLEGVAVSEWVAGGRVARRVNSVPGWSRMAKPSIESEVELFHVAEIASGWPMRCLSCAITRPEKPLMPLPLRWKYSVIDGLKLAPRFGPRGAPDEPRVLPLQPISLGFAVNTMLYGALMWVLWIMFAITVCKAMRIPARMRRRRGCCPKCGYQLRGKLDSGCPECGWGRGDQ